MVIIIICEGPDGSGKTTLVKKLTKALQTDWPAVTIPSRGPRDGSELRKEVKSVLAAEINHTHKPNVAVFDRFFFSELIYSPLLGRKCAFSDEDSRIYRGVLQSLRVPIIICLPIHKTVMTNWENRSDDRAGVGPNLSRIWYRYNELSHTPGLNTFQYNYENEAADVGFRNMLAHINGYLDQRKKRLNG